MATLHWDHSGANLSYCRNKTVSIWGVCLGPTILSFMNGDMFNSIAISITDCQKHSSSCSGRRGKHWQMDYQCLIGSSKVMRYSRKPWFHNKEEEDCHRFLTAIVRFGKPAEIIHG